MITNWVRKHPWLYLCDSVYDLFHLRGRYGQKTFRGWWETRQSEWLGAVEYNRRLRL